MSLKMMSANRNISFLHMMKSKNLDLFGKLRRHPLSLKEWQALWSLLDTTGMYSLIAQETVFPPP